MLEKARRSAPTNPEVLRAVASYYRDTGQYEEAVRILEDLHAERREHARGTGIFLRSGRQRASGRATIMAQRQAERHGISRSNSMPHKPCSMLGSSTKPRPC